MTTPDFAFRREQDDDDRPPPGAEPEPQDGDETPAGTGQEETRDGFFGRLGGFFRPGAVIDTAVAQNRSSDLIAADGVVQVVSSRGTWDGCCLMESQDGLHSLRQHSGEWIGINRDAASAVRVAEAI